jgi:threonine aldolase
VTALEAAFATLLGKERAIMVPTGTLANLMGARLMAEGRPGPRLIVHRDSHLFNDAGDNLTFSAGVTMVPLVSEGASFSAAQVAAEIARARSARVRASIAGIVIETPSRRLDARRFDPAERDAVAALARSEGIALYLDGARLFIEAQWAGQSPAEIAAPFDYIYVSLYKYLGAPFGSVLAGPAAKLEGQFHERRRLGGGLYQMWPAALLALDALPRQAERWRRARVAGTAVLAAFEAAGIPVRRFADGSNAVRIAAGRAAATAEAVRTQTAASRLKLPVAQGGELLVKINETWDADTPDAIARRLKALIG